MAWLPAIVILLGMPVLALVTTKYALVPSMKRVFAQEAVATQGNPVFLVKIPLNASGAMGAHSGFRSLGLVGADSTLKDKVDQNKAKLMNLAASDSAAKRFPIWINPASWMQSAPGFGPTLTVRWADPLSKKFLSRSIRSLSRLTALPFLFGRFGQAFARNAVRSHLRHLA